MQCPCLTAYAYRCQGCEVGFSTAVALCSVCKEKLCSECVQAHKRVNATKFHALSALLPAGSRAPHVLPCPRHPGVPMDAYCETCAVIFCKDCGGRHEGHNTGQALAAAPNQVATNGQTYNHTC